MRCTFTSPTHLHIADNLFNHSSQSNLGTQCRDGGSEPQGRSLPPLLALWPWLIYQLCPLPACVPGKPFTQWGRWAWAGWLLGGQGQSRGGRGGDRPSPKHVSSQALSGQMASQPDLRALELMFPELSICKATRGFLD